jgi:cytochrome P450
MAISASSTPGAASGLREFPAKPSGLPLIGDSLVWMRDADAYYRHLHENYGEVCRVSAFGKHVYMLMGPDANQFVLQNRGDLFANSQWEYYIGPFFRRGLMLLDFDEHRLHRRIMQDAFTREAIVGYLDKMQPRIDRELDGWEPRDGFRMFDHLKILTLNVGTEVFVGIPPGSETDRLNRAFLATVRAGTGIIRFGLPGTRWHAGLRGRRTLEQFFLRELPAKKATESDDLFAKLCRARGDDGSALSDEDIVNHMIFVLMAAHDTSTITLTNMIYQLARAPEWQERLRAESLALGKTRLDYDDLDRLHGMTLVMKETLRLTAPVPGLPRKATRDCEYKGYRIPAGAHVGITPWLTHRLPEYWSNPERFDPQRFEEGRAEDRKHPFLWVPFGGGAHKCIGMHFGQMEIKAILHRLLLRYRWSVPEGYTMKQDFTSLPIPRDRLPLQIASL